MAGVGAVRRAQRRYPDDVRRRLDLELVRRSLASSRAEAAALIEARRVTVGGVVAGKPSRLVSPAEPVEIAGPPRQYVGRGGEKLAAALGQFDISVVDRSVLDAGSSTGGFTDCLLQHGARRVAGFDVGRGQLHERLMADARVVQRDRFNVRSLTPADLPFPCSLLVADLSFISLTLVLGPLVKCLTPEDGHERPEGVVLVKPQFEVGRREASRGGGVITDPVLHRAANQSVGDAFRALGWQVRDVMESPIRGAEGNVEFLMWASGPGRNENLGQNLSVTPRVDGMLSGEGRE